MKIEEGYMPFRGFKTYYRIVGEANGKAPLLLIHGGPGSSHNYFELLDDYAETGDCQLIMYDQVAAGNPPCQKMSPSTSKRPGQKN